MVTATELVDALDAAGFRRTAPRRALAVLIASWAGHFSAERLFVESKARRLGLTRATIFRTLDVLGGLGVLERVDLPTGEHAFVTCGPSHHHHVVCSSCGRAASVPDCGVAAIADDIARHTGYRLDTHRIEIHGICPACQAASPQPA
jgi:Fur family ferric uptake transcriptional regulator